MASWIGDIPPGGGPFKKEYAKSEIDEMFASTIGSMVTGTFGPPTATDAMMQQQPSMQQHIQNMRRLEEANAYKMLGPQEMRIMADVKEFGGVDEPKYKRPIDTLRRETAKWLEHALDQ